MLEKNNKIMLFVDFQEKLMPAMEEVERLEDKTVRLAKGAVVLGLPIIVTEQYAKGLGNTVAPINDAFDGNAEYFDKIHFSAVAEEGFKELLEKKGKGYKEVVVSGIESHICVMQTALDLVNIGYKVYVIEDCVSSRNLNDKKIAINRMSNAGVIVTTSESILFEILGNAKEKEFKEISKIIK